MTNKLFETVTLTTVIGSIVIVCATPAFAQPSDVLLAEAQQKQLAADILSAESDIRQTSVLIAQGLGASRMSDDVRVALIELLTQLNNALEIGARDQVALESIVNGEFYLSLAETVATLRDPSAVPALVKVGNYGFSRAAGRGLASLGEQALPSIIEVLDNPASSSDLVAYNLMALSAMMHEPEVAPKLSPAARDEIARMAGNSLGSEHGATLLMATELAVALGRPELTQVVTAISQDSRILSARGVRPETAELVRKYAADTLAKASAEASTR